MSKKDLKEKKFFLIRRVNSYASDTSDIWGFTDDEDYAKSLQTVFCDYEEIKYLEPKNVNDSNRK